MPKCDACRAEGAKLRCHKCQGCWSCHKACAKRFWPTHKKFCTDDPALKPHVPIELAVERILAKVPKTEAPPNATYYICLEIEGPKGGKVMRGCACRGPSAGFAHVDCLAEMASRNEWIDLGGERKLNRWLDCPTCHSGYVSALMIEMGRRNWRRERDNPPSGSTYHALKAMALHLRRYDEPDAADRLDADSMRGLTDNDDDPFTQLRQDLLRANDHFDSGRYHEALEILTRLRPSVERQTDLSLRSFHADFTARTLGTLGRLQDALPFAVEAVEGATKAAGAESKATLNSTQLHARILAGLGRREEAKATLARVLAAQTRVLGADHPCTLETNELLDHLSACETVA